MAVGDEFALLRDAAPAELDQLLARARRRSFGAGEVVFHSGDPADTLHLIRRGRFAVRIMTEFGDAATLNVIGPGDAFGELALLTPGAPRSATISSLEDGETLSIHQIEFTALRERVPTIDRFLIGLLAVQVRRLSSQLVEALYLPADTRVRRRLLDVCSAFGPVQAGAIVPLTQEDLASLAGTSRATVNKVLREEQEAGVVELSRGRTTLLDPAALERKARPFG